MAASDLLRPGRLRCPPPSGKVTCESVDDELVIAPSARKHGVSDDDIVHAYAHPLRVFDLDEGFTMLVGPSRAAAMLEVGVVEGETSDVVVHAMPAREKFLR